MAFTLSPSELVFALEFKFIALYFLVSEGSLSSAVLVECSSRGLKVLITRSLMPNFDPSAFHLTDKSCDATLVNRTHVVLRTEFKKCGTTRQTYHGSTTYANVLHGYPKNRLPYFSLTRRCNTNFPIKCFVDESAQSGRNATELDKMTKQENGKWDFISA